ncbi:MAG: metallophosphoesterase [Terriglobia bacterium]
MHHLHHPVSAAGLIAISVLTLFVGSQVFWLWKIRVWKQHLCHTKALRICLDFVGALLYILLFYYGIWGTRHIPSPTRLTLGAALLRAPFASWFFGSLLGFIVYLVVRGAGFLVDAAVWPLEGRGFNPAGKKSKTSSLFSLSRFRERLKRRPAGVRKSVVQGPALRNPARRQFFRQTATALGAVPFAAGAYGILYGRLNLKVTNPRIALPHLPRAFDGFRILQLSDLHIGPFMTAREIRKIVEISNRAKPDLVALTGDFVTWDASTQYAVVEALSGLKAPYGVWGCLGNHEIWTHTEDSITALFALRGFRILRQESAMVFERADFINLIGVDYQSRRSFGRHGAGFVHEYLQGVNSLMNPGAVNILFSHNPNTFDRAAELDIDLSLAGHTHGGQVSLEFVNVNISPSRLITPYVAGWFQKGRGQLYVNRGIGTIGLPMRIGAPPEITIYHLVRGPLAPPA